MQIERLSQRQVAICERLWECDSYEEVNSYMRDLSSEDKKTAKVLIELIIQNGLEESIQQMTRYPDAEAIFNKIKG